jgi:integrase/recombinase XerD
MDTNQQIPLFPAIAADSPIQTAIGAFDQWLKTRDEINPIKYKKKTTQNTRKAFASDIRLLGQYLGIGQPVGEIGTNNLNDFLSWLMFERGVPCSRKSYARRVTTLKAFFGWLQESGVLHSNPADAVTQISVTSPLPTLSDEEELERALAVTEALRIGSKEQKPDSRPHLLLTLLLQTGIKKSEAMAIVPNHIDRDDPGEPYLFVRYSNPGLREKERKLALEPDWLITLDEYLEQFAPTDTLFTCTARNLEYVLSDVAEAAGLPKGSLSFENLRWISALRDYSAGMEPNEIREKLGLAPVSWRETKSKLEKLNRSRQNAQANTS